MARDRRSSTIRRGSLPGRRCIRVRPPRTSAANSLSRSRRRIAARLRTTACAFRRCFRALPGDTTRWWAGRGDGKSDSVCSLWSAGWCCVRRVFRCCRGLRSAKRTRQSAERGEHAVASAVHDAYGKTGFGFCLAASAHVTRLIAVVCSPRIVSSGHGYSPHVAAAPALPESTAPRPPGIGSAQALSQPSATGRRPPARMRPASPCWTG